MRLTIVRSVEPVDKTRSDDPYLQTFDTRYAARVIGNLQNEAKFCTSCGPDCINCRKKLRRPLVQDLREGVSAPPNSAFSAPACPRTCPPSRPAGGGRRARAGRTLRETSSPENDTVQVVDLPAVLPYVLEDPSRHVPREIAENDILLLINIHEQILLEIVKRCREWGTKGVVVPLEAPDWVRGGARAEAQRICEKLGVEIAFPKPFCAFDPPRGGVLADFRLRFQVGKPDVKLELDGSVIKHAHVNVSAACGATYYIARWLEGRNVEENLEIEVISRRLHSYPCTASMERDPELNDDTCLHVSDQAHLQILAGCGRAISTESDMVMSPLGILVQKAVPFADNVRNVEEAKAIVLQALSAASSVSLDDLKKSRVTPAALNTALLLLKKEGKIRVVGRQIQSGM